VEVKVGYNDLPFKVRKDYFRISEEKVLAPVTFEIENKDLTFKEENGSRTARVAIYGIITSITNRYVSEFEDELTVSYPPQYFEKGLLERSVYQKIVAVESRLRYRVDLVVKDLNSGKTGVSREALLPPAYPAEGLAASSLILSDSIYQLRGPSSAQEEMFLIGDVKVRPKLSLEFSADRPFGAYLQLYNVKIDQSTSQPSLSMRYRIMRDGKQVKYWSDSRGESIQFLSDRRVVLVKPLPLSKLQPGPYTLEVEIEDELSNQKARITQNFNVRQE